MKPRFNMAMPDLLADYRTTWDDQITLYVRHGYGGWLRKGTYGTRAKAEQVYEQMKADKRLYRELCDLRS